MQSLEQRMKSIEIKNRSQFMRKMALQGYMIRVQLPEIERLLVLLSNATNNLNQIARRVNGGSLLYGSDIEILRRDYQGLREMLNEMLRSLRPDKQ